MVGPVGGIGISLMMPGRLDCKQKNGRSLAGPNFRVGKVDHCSFF